MTLAYIRISTNKQDIDTQKLEIHEYCHKNNIKIDKFIEIEQSSRKSQEKRRISELYEELNEGDILIVTELSRLGRSMFEVIQLVIELAGRGIHFIFLRQPELTTFKNAHSKLLLAFYAYIAETERDFISQRTKAGLEKARQSGKKLGRPFGSLSSVYDKDKDKIIELRKRGLPRKSIWLLLEYPNKPKTYGSFWRFCNKRNIP